MRLEPGDIVLVPFPFTDLTSSKSRPAFVISDGRYYASSRDVIVLGVTSNLSNAAHSVMMKDSDLLRGKLKATSRIKADKVATLEQSIVRRVVGRAKPVLLGHVMREFLSLFPDAGS